MTAAGFEALKTELEELKARRPSLVAEVSNARSQGDLSENFAYHDARRQLGMLDGRVETVENTIRRAQIVEEAGADGKVRMGCTVVVSDEFGESTYQVVGPTEGNMSRGMLSVASPLGKALLNHRAGETVFFMSPAGEQKAMIVSVD
jgi:transcription elongation factor GreA